MPNDSKPTGPKQLKGRSIAVAQGSSADYQLVASLRKAGLSLGDVEVEYLQPADAPAAFTAAKVDAWAVRDPYTSQVLLSKQGRVLTTGDEITDGLTFQVEQGGLRRLRGPAPQRRPAAVDRTGPRVVPGGRSAPPTRLVEA